ncbi:hypothetical protein CRENBAI_026432 [Crenichthys baileyi]|uniref:Uncharacterized protein n=1 Tax=Crenichthys baileyi TaxID=28760 RepID=A0AAV9RVX2_9TELE
MISQRPSPTGPETDTEILAIDIQRPPRAQEPQENHCRYYHNPPEKIRGTTQQPQCTTPGSCSDEPPGPAGSRLCPSRSSHGPRGNQPPDPGGDPLPSVATPALNPTPAPTPLPNNPPSSSGEGAMYKRGVYMVQTSPPTRTTTG